MQQVIELILRREWELLLDAGQAWNQIENNGVPQLIIITGLLFKGNYREAYDQHEALFSTSEDVESKDDPRPRPDLHRPGGARRGQVGRYADVWSRHRQRRQNYLIQQQLTDTDSD